MSALDGYWARYDATLARVRAERPSTFAELKAILDTFGSPSSGDAFFPSQSADEELWEVLQGTGWRIEWVEGGYWYRARHSVTGARLEFVEGDLYDRTDDAQARLDALNRAFGGAPGCAPRFTAEAEGDEYLFGKTPASG